MQESISSLYATSNFSYYLGVEFDKLPSMKFDGSQTNWRQIIHNNIFGPFAPKSGVLGSFQSQEEGSIEKLMKLHAKKISSNNAQESGKGRRISKLIRKKSFLGRADLNLINQIRLRKFEELLNKKAQKKPSTRLLCNIYYGTKVFIYYK